MIAAELRGGQKPSLNEALSWIGSRVDDIYGANVGRLEDVWIDPGTGVPRWLLVKEGRFGGRTTLIPFEDATAGAGHVWVPYEREIVRTAPEIEPGAPLTQQVEVALRNHYAANLPAAITQRAVTPMAPPGAGRVPGSAMGTATIRFAGAPVAGPANRFVPAAQTPVEPPPPQIRVPHAPPRRHVLREQAPPVAPTQGSYGYAESQPPPATQLPDRPAPPVAASSAGFMRGEPRMPQSQPPPTYVDGPAQSRAFAYQRWDQQQQQPAQQRSEPAPEQYRPWPQEAPPLQPQPAAAIPADPAQGPVDALRSLAEAGGSHYVEIELSGELTIRGELRTIRVTPSGPEPRL